MAPIAPNLYHASAISNRFTEAGGSTKVNVAPWCGVLAVFGTSSSGFSNEL